MKQRQIQCSSTFMTFWLHPPYTSSLLVSNFFPSIGWIELLLVARPIQYTNIITNYASFNVSSDMSTPAWNILHQNILKILCRNLYLIVTEIFLHCNPNQESFMKIDPLLFGNDISLILHWQIDVFFPTLSFCHIS